MVYILENPSMTFSRRLVPRTVTSRIILHHTAGRDLPIETIHEMHRQRGWGGIGYHFLIRTDGLVFEGVPLPMRGIHAGRANADSIGIALTGNFEQHRPSGRQLKSLERLVRYLRGLHPHWNNLPVLLHKDVSATLCPGRLFPWGTL